MVFPWQLKQWQTLWQSKKIGRMPTALLLSGIKGLGKRAFAEHFVKALLCQQQNAEGKVCQDLECELCQQCHLIDQLSHPNFNLVSPGEEGGVIKIEQIREAIAFIHQTSFSGIFRFLIIDPADALNHAAANALLKTLEEPAHGAIIILICQQQGKLPATVRSRCQRIVFQKPDKTTALQWLRHSVQTALKDDEMINLLELGQGAPLQALQLLNHQQVNLRSDLYNQLISIMAGKLEPSQAVDGLLDHSPEMQFEFLISWLLDLLRIQLGGKLESIRNQDYKQQLLELQFKTHLNKNIKLVHYVKELQQSLHLGASLNKQLMIESVLIRWSQCQVAEEICI